MHAIFFEQLFCSKLLLKLVLTRFYLRIVFIPFQHILPKLGVKQSGGVFGAIFDISLGLRKSMI